MDLPIRIIGLNTALLCQNDDDNGKLRLSLNQIKGIPTIEDSQSYLVIGLGHHPFNWLHDGDEAEKWLRKRIHIYLSGHVHSPNSLAYRQGSGGELVSVQAGAVHNEDYPGATQDSFNYAAVVQKNDGSIVLRIWNRIWSNNNKDFRDDPDFHPVDQTYAEFSLRINNGTLPKDNSAFKNNTSFSFARKSRFISDSPPLVDVWVGRKNELNIAEKIGSGVLAITGIGGQGKSALASKFLDEWISEHPNAFWDWRDCREQRERFHSHLVGIIEHWTDGNILGESLEGGETIDLVRLFFDLAEKQSGLIILDNVDHYVEVENSQFTLGVADFVKAALERQHNLTIIFTCRPKINYASTRFQEIHLAGLSGEETIELFQLREVDVEENIHNIKKIYELTDGHPFWLNLIATQVAQQPLRSKEIIGELEGGEIDNRAKIIMNTTWKQLDTKQKTILRYMAELTGPEDIDWIFDCVRTSKEFKTTSKFNHVFFSLQALNLLVESRGKYSNQKEYDLHPIVRNYIVSEFSGKRERTPFQDGILWVINTYISKFGGKVTIATPISDLYNYIKKAEISIKKEDVKTSISSLLQVSDPLIRRGLPGELFRVGEDILDLVEKNHEKYIDLDNFHALSDTLGCTYVEYGRKPEAIAHVERYSKLVPKGTAQYVSVCEVACYVYWMLGEFEMALSWGKEGVRLKNEEHIDTQYDSAYYLALTWRDSGNTAPALDYFLSGKSVEEALHDLNEEESDDEIEEDHLGSSRLGNIGRYLQLIGDFDKALKFYIASARLLEKKATARDTLNQGYAALWIGEVLEMKEDYRSAYIAYRRSEIVWNKRAPLRADEPKEKAIKVIDYVNDKTIFGLTEMGIERLFRDLIWKS